ncbi:hypothetical protein JVU11DRAFT_1555 [Chiua virens]|nr:hypothetical protein JVU11DRAFT_1555 [Chiua virens]
MSHNQSPGPSALPSSQMFVQPASVTPSSRQKNKAYATGIAAGVEDEKYQAKYKELKRKVKEIEMDNDKLQFKVLMAKKSIQRMKLERAVLYERLSAVPPSPDLHAHAPLPPMHPGPGVPPQHAQHIPTSGQHRDSRSMDANDANTPDYAHPSGNIRVVSGPDGRPVQVSDGPIGPGVAPSHAVSGVQLSRRGSTSGHDSRQLPPLSQLTPVQHLEHPRGHPHSQSQPSHLHSHSTGSDSRSRPHSSSHSRGQAPPQGYLQGGVPHPQQYPSESVPSAQGGLQSPPLGHERERSRRYDSHERSNHSGDPYPHGRHQMAHASPHSAFMSPTSARGSTTRVHNHQRVGPTTSINHPDLDHERDLERERNWPRQREHDSYDRELPRDYTNSGPVRNSPPPHLRTRSERDYQDHPSYRLREDQVYPREPVGQSLYGRSSRSDTPGSGSGSVEAPSRSDVHAHHYDRERQRPYAPRGINQPHTPNEDIDFVHEDGRSHNRDREHGGSYMPLEQHRPPLESSRKRSRNDMDMDGEDDVASPAGDSSTGGDGTMRYGGNHRTDDRGSKRLHQEGMASSAQGYGIDEPEDGHSGD